MGHLNWDIALNWYVLPILFPLGAPILRNGRCSCINTKEVMIHLKSLQDLKQFAPSLSCEKTEIM